jgi:hypothetical protein
MGDDALVPPKTIQPEYPEYGSESYTATPVFGSATAETSDSERFLQPLSVCHDGFATYRLQPLPLPDQAVSDQPRALLAVRSDVPPTQTTLAYEHGCCAPYPLSPALAVMIWPG